MKEEESIPIFELLRATRGARVTVNRVNTTSSNVGATKVEQGCTLSDRSSLFSNVLFFRLLLNQLNKAPKTRTL